MSCTSFFIDDVQYQKANDGVKFEPLGAELYPMRGWSIELSKGNAYSEANEIYQKVILSGGGVEVIDDVPFVPVIGWTDSTGQIYIIGCQLVNQTVVPMPVIPAGYALIHNSNDTFSQLAIIDEEVILTDVQVTEWDGSITTHPAARPITAKIAPDSSVVSSGGTPAINITGIRPGDALSVPDISYTDFRGDTVAVEAGLDIVSVIPDQNEITNSDGTVLALLDAEEDFEVPDSVITLPDSTTVNVPAATNYTVPNMAGIIIPILFPVNYSNEATVIIDTDNAGTYDTADFVLDNVASVSYKVNGGAVSGSFTVVNADVLTITITRTTATADSSVVVLQYATDCTFVTSASSGYSPQVPQEFEAIAGQLAYTLPVNLSNNYWVFINGSKLPTTKYTGNAGQAIITFVDIVFDGGELITIINW